MQTSGNEQEPKPSVEQLMPLAPSEEDCIPPVREHPLAEAMAAAKAERKRR